MAAAQPQRPLDHCRGMKTLPLIAALLLAACNAADAPQADDVDTAGPPGSPAPAANVSANVSANEDSGEGVTQAEKPVSACLVQDGEPVPANALKAIGTEPFWGARIDGRCVTYSTPEDQDGTRVWTKFSGTAENGSWTGYLDDQRFVLRTRPQPGCSDGMSDNRYPIAVTLTVRGEERTGCALPL